MTHGLIFEASAIARGQGPDDDDDDDDDSSVVLEVYGLL